MISIFIKNSEIFHVNSYLVILNFLLGFENDYNGIPVGILTRVGCAFTALLIMLCWKLELTEIVIKCKFFIF